MELINWMSRRTNEEALDIVEEKRGLVVMMERRKKNWIGHILRGEGMLKEVIEGRMKRERPR